MIDEYAIVGPAIFVMENMPSEAELVKQNGKPIIPHELWIEIHSIWIRLNGEWVSGLDARGRRIEFRPNWINRFKIRRAATKWIRSRM